MDIAWLDELCAEIDKLKDELSREWERKTILKQALEGLRRDIDKNSSIDGGHLLIGRINNALEAARD